MKLIADVLLTLIQSANIPKIPSFIEKHGQTRSKKKAIDSYISLLQDLSKHYSNGLYQHLISEKKSEYKTDNQLTCLKIFISIHVYLTVLIVLRIITNWVSLFLGSKSMVPY